jgi:hypothetical protein
VSEAIVCPGLLLIILLLSCTGFSQTLRFCEYTDTHGKETGCGNFFELRSDTLTLMLIVDMNNKKVNADSVEYSFYKLNENKFQEFVAKVPLAVRKSSSYFFLPIDFYNEGTYFVKVATISGDFLAEGRFMIGLPAGEQDPKPK